MLQKFWWCYAGTWSLNFWNEVSGQCTRWGLLRSLLSMNPFYWYLVTWMRDISWLSRRIRSLQTSPFVSKLVFRRYNGCLYYFIYCWEMDESWDGLSMKFFCCSFYVTMTSLFIMSILLYFQRLSSDILVERREIGFSVTLYPSVCC